MRDDVRVSQGSKTFPISGNMSHIDFKGAFTSQRAYVKSSNGEVIFLIKHLPDSQVEALFICIEIQRPIEHGFIDIVFNFLNNLERFGISCKEGEHKVGVVA